MAFLTKMIKLKSVLASSFKLSRPYSSANALHKCLSWGCTEQNFISNELAEELLKSLGKYDCLSLWDLENCPVPHYIRAENIADILRMKLKEFYGVKGAVKIRAYADFSRNFGNVPELLDVSGVELIHTPHGNSKEVADKRIIKDLTSLGQSPVPKIAHLISGDKGFAHYLKMLQMQGHTTLVTVPQLETAMELSAAAHHTTHWCGLVLQSSKGDYKSQKEGAVFNFLASKDDKVLEKYAEPIKLRLMSMLLNSPMVDEPGAQALQRVHETYASYYGEKLDLRLFEMEKVSDFVKKYAVEMFEIVANEDPEYLDLLKLKDWDGVQLM